VKGDS
jgi:hypothetical protein